MKKIHFQMNNRGTILQVVLIIFMILILNIGLILNTVIVNSNSIRQIQQLDKNRLIELSILRYYKESILNGVLISDEIKVDDYMINYTVDDFESYYYIVTTISENEQNYSFKLKIDRQSIVILEFDY